jgi:hypothetical protein
MLACLWYDADDLSRQHVDAEHMALAINADMSARLANRLQAQLADVLESEVAG